MKTIELITAALLMLLIVAAVPVFGLMAPEGSHPELPQVQNYQEYVESIEYPEECRELGIEGRVLIRVQIDEQGQLRDHWVLDSPDQLLTNACLDQIESLRFTPSRDSRGQSLPAFVLVPVTFRLREN